MHPSSHTHTMWLAMASLLFLLLVVTFLRPATAFCVARNSSNFGFLYESKPANSPPSTPADSTPSATTSSLLAEQMSLPHLLSLPPIHAAAINALCKRTDYPDVCLSSTQPLAPQVAGAVGAGNTIDPTGLLNLLVQACRAKAEMAQKQVGTLFHNPATSSRLASYLQACSDSYDDAFDNLDVAVVAMKSRDKGTLNSMLSAVVDDFATCEDGFVEMGVASPLKVLDDVLSKMASNCLSIAALI